MNILSKSLSIALTVAAFAIAPFAVSADEYPSKPIKLIVPFGAGGGSDSVARALQFAIQENNLLDVPVVVVNMKGAGGSVGGGAVANADPDGYTIGIWHYGMLTSNALGISPVTPDDVSTIGLLGRWNSILIARTDSGYKNLSDVIEDALARPGKVVEATALGSAPHLQHEMLKSKVDGLNIKLLQSGGGANRLAAILGGHADVTIYSMGEHVGNKNPDISALVQFAPERNPVLPDVPTARELGIDQVWNNYNWFFAPKGTSADRVEYLYKVVETAMATPSFQKMLENRSLTKELLNAEEAAAIYGPAYEEIKAAAALMETKK